jgi:hypothetical protein
LGCALICGNNAGQQTQQQRQQQQQQRRQQQVQRRQRQQISRDQCQLQHSKPIWLFQSSGQADVARAHALQVAGMPCTNAASNMSTGFTTLTHCRLVFRCIEHGLKERKVVSMKTEELALHSIILW